MNNTELAGVNINMDNELFSKEEAEYLIPLLKNGKVILFLGAGFTRGLNNVANGKIPSSAEFANRMNNCLKAMSQKGFSESEADDLAKVSFGFLEFFKSLNLPFITTFFEQNLKVNKDSIPKEYSTITNIPWKNIYTTNYDDTLEVIYKEMIDSKIVEKISFKKNKSDHDNGQGMKLIYLNGDLNINPQIDGGTLFTDILCSTTDYNASTEPLLWEHFVHEFIYYPIIIIGSKFDEDPFFQRIFKLISKSTIDLSKRPLSFIINMDEESSYTKPAYGMYNLIHRPGDTMRFLKWLSDNITGLPERSIIQGHSPIINGSKKSPVIEFTKEYWDNLKGQKTSDSLLQYYTNINSAPLLLPYIIADEFYVEPTEEIWLSNFADPEEETKYYIEDLLKEGGQKESRLIWIHANGGTGKSTLLYHIGKKYCEDYHILYLADLSDDDFELPEYDDDKNVIILLDNYKRYLNKIISISKRLNDLYYLNGYKFIIFERLLSAFSVGLDIRELINENFTFNKTGTLKPSTEFYSRVYSKITGLVPAINNLPANEQEDIKKHFLKKHSKATTAERVFNYMWKLGQLDNTTSFTFDWDEWRKTCSDPENEFVEYQNLYQVVAVFNRYGVTPPIEFCITLLGIKDPNGVKTVGRFSSVTADLPIMITGGLFFELRNPNLAEWYVLARDINSIQTNLYFKKALYIIDTSDKMYIFRNVFKNEEINNIPLLKQLIPGDSQGRLSIFRSYINSYPADPDNYDNLMEMYNIYLGDQDIQNAICILREMILYPRNMFAKIKLTDLLLGEAQYEEAQLLSENLYHQDPDNNYILKLRIQALAKSGSEIPVMKELLNEIPDESISSKQYVYSRLANQLLKDECYEEAIIYCNILLDINPKDSFIMNTLGKICKEKKQYFDAINWFNKALEIQPNDSHNYNELGQVYIHLYYINREYKYKENALKIFIKGIRCSKNNIPLRNQFAIFLTGECNRNKCAENILIWNINQDKYHIYSYTELGKLYQKVNRWDESKKILEEGRSRVPRGKRKIESLPLLVILGNTYIQLKQFDKAEEIFNESLILYRNNVESYIGLSKIDFYLKNQESFDNCINIVLDKSTNTVQLGEFAKWLHYNHLFTEEYKIINKALTVDTSEFNYHLNSLKGNNLLEQIKMIPPNHLNEGETFKKIGEFVNHSEQVLSKKEDSEQTLHLLYRCYLYISDSFHNIGEYYLSGMYSKQYKKYLGILYLVNKINSYAIEGLLEHLKRQRRYRVALELAEISRLKKSNEPLYCGQLIIFNSFLGRMDLVSELINYARSRNINIPNIIEIENYKLLSSDNIGYYENDSISMDNKTYPVLNNKNLALCYSVSNLYNNTNQKVKVFFEIFQVDNIEYANCIEPYFDSIPSDNSVIHFFELD